MNHEATTTLTRAGSLMRKTSVGLGYLLQRGNLLSPDVQAARRVRQHAAGPRSKPMPDLPDSTSPEVSAAVPPVIDPAAWEDLPHLRFELVRVADSVTRRRKRKPYTVHTRGNHYPRRGRYLPRRGTSRSPRGMVPSPSGTEPGNLGTAPSQRG